MDIFKRDPRNLKSLGYEFSPICDYTENPGEKRIYLRHDIDTDPKIALKMAQVEHNLGIRGTYYFRWCTFNKKKSMKFASWIWKSVITMKK